MENGRVTSVNGLPPTHLDQRPDFAKLGAVHPSRPLRLETLQASSPRTAEIQRVVDLICPLGFGQRALIVSPPKAGKTVMLQAVAEGVALNHPAAIRSEEHTSELQSQSNLVCRLLLEKKKKRTQKRNARLMQPYSRQSMGRSAKNSAITQLLRELTSRPHACGLSRSCRSLFRYYCDVH